MGSDNEKSVAKVTMNTGLVLVILGYAIIAWDGPGKWFGAIVGAIGFFLAVYGLVNT